MPRAQSPSSDQEEGTDVILQEELDKLKNEVRIHQNDKQKYEEDVKNKISKYNSEIDHLDADNSQLKLMLSQAESDQNKKADHKNLNQLKHHNNDHDDYINQIEEERQKIAGLDAEIKKYDRMTKKQRSSKENRDSSSKDKENSQVQKMVQKRTLTLENRLDKQNKVYNDTLTENGQLREEIEKLRNQRAIFNDVHSKLDIELENVRAEKAKLTEQATLAYDHRDEANNKCLALKEKNDKDLAQFLIEMRDLQRIIDHDNKLRDFMNTKSNERIEWKKMEEERRRKHGSAGEIARKLQRRQIQTYDEAFLRIKEITTEEDLNLIVEGFIKNEDENFSLFQYVSELNNKVEILHENIERIAADIEIYKSEEVTLEVERHKILHDLEIQMDDTKQHADKAEARLTEVNKILDQLRTGVKSVFGKSGCDDSVILEILGGDQDVTNRNIMMYLGTVEQQTNALLAVEYYIQTNKFNMEQRLEQPEHGITLGLQHYYKPPKESAVLPPGIGDNVEDSSEASGDEIRPLSQHELLQRVLKDMRRRETTGHSHSKSKARPSKRVS